ncbi:MAG TPA: RNase adapter RapZ [Clostridia bacterium]|nr:RNase adapter RapZ [Clostridia bacterium]
MKLVIITGMSGAGKSNAANFLEDIGFYCVDNMPPVLMNKFIDVLVENKEVSKAAIITDIRGGSFFDDLFENMEELKRRGINYEIVFLEASNEELIRRFKQTRRMHPLSQDGSLEEGIEKEKARLGKLREKANHIIDTTDMIPSQFKEILQSLYIKGEKSSNITVNIISFGYKNGIPLDSDLVFDVRFLPNPHYIEDLREYTGNDESVRNYVMQWTESKEFMERLKSMIDFLMPYYIREGKYRLIVAVGCTGGKHRSVTVANELYEYMKGKGDKVVVKHRDISR